MSGATSLPSRRVLVTRAEPGASATARRLAARGFTPVVEPLFTLEPLAPELRTFDALAFTSANGVRAFARLSPRRDAPVFCVGARTAEAARDAGFAAVTSADGDVVALAALIRRNLVPDAILLHAGNEESRGDLTGALKAAGIDARFRALYRAAPVAAPGPALAAFLAGQPAFDAVTIHSPRAAAILAGFLGDAPRATLFVATISGAAAEPLSPVAGRIAIAAAPDENSLVTALESLVSRA